MSILKDQYVCDLERLLTLTEEITKLKALYEEYDLIVLRLHSLGFTEAECGGKTLTLQDNFKEKNTAYRVAFVKRFDVKVTSVRGRSGDSAGSGSGRSDNSGE